MKEILYLIIYILTEIVNYHMAYTIIFEMYAEKNKKKWIVGIISLLTIHMLAYITIGSETARTISVITMIIVPFCFVVGDLKKRILLYPIIYILVGCIGISMSFIVGTFLGIPEYQVVQSAVLTLVCQFIPMFCMGILFVYRKIRKYEKIQIQLDKKQYILFYIGIVSTFFLLATLQYISEKNVTKTIINFYGISSSVICMTMLFLIIWQGISSKREDEYKREREYYNIYMHMQEENIRDVIHQDSRLRSIKHDMNKHFVALRGYADNGDIEGIKEYIDDMYESAMINSVEEYTGNNAIDAIVRQMVSYANSKEIDIKINASMINTEERSIFDLCTVISNILKNSIEACEKIESSSCRKIEMSMMMFEKKISITIRNTVEGNVNIMGEKLVTTKTDKKNHGIGSENVRKIVKKYDGMLEYSNENGWFCVDIIL